MNRILGITVCALSLAACASTYNKAAMPLAASRLQLDTGICEARWTAKEFKTYSAWQACQLTAERSFAVAIALTRMDAFEEYAAGMRMLAADRDAGRVTDHQVRSRANDVYWRFLAECGCKPQRLQRSLPSNAGSIGDYQNPDDHMPSGNLSQPH